MMIRAIFFDYDGVLTVDATGSLTTCRYLSRHTGIPYEDVYRAFVPHNEALNLGKVTYADVWSSVCGILGRAISIDLLIGAFESTPVNEEMFALARQLRVTCATGIITDNKKERMDLLRRHQCLDALFAPIVVSALTRSTKKDVAIFEHALMLSGTRPEETVFIDNSRGNLVAAAALGINVIHFDDSKNDVAELAQHLRARYAASSKQNVA